MNTITSNDAKPGSPLHSILETTEERDAAFKVIEEAKCALLELIEHWDEHSDSNKIRQIKDVIEEIL